MSNFLYIDGSCGISGDMMVAALIDLGADKAKLLKMLHSLELDDEFEVVVSRRLSYGIDGNDFEVIIKHEHHEHNHEHCHEHHEHNHEHCHEHHEHINRNLADIEAIISRAELNSNASSLAKKIFRIVAEAEAKVHGKSIEEVHFHEVGAIDSIIDILAAAFCIDDLNITQIALNYLSEGEGFVKCQHGSLPIPVPAVSEIISQYKLPIRLTGAKGEMITPTGAAIAGAMINSSVPEVFTIKQIGLGAGKRDFGRPNLLRLMLLDVAPAELNKDEEIWVLESNIDDSTGEELGLAMNRLFEAGALDVHYTPCFMKKNRPGWLLRVVAESALVGELEKIIFANTSTIGIRRFAVERSVMTREIVSVDTPLGLVAVKLCRWSGICRCYPEYESVKKLADATGHDFRSIFAAAQLSAEEFCKAK